jgi:hypothetical protein
VSTPRRTITGIRLRPTAGVQDVIHFMDLTVDDGESVMVTALCGLELPRDAIERTVGNAHIPCVQALQEITDGADPFSPFPIRLA